MRLFEALEARNRDLTEALEQQTATAEILQVISSSPTDVQPIFDTIVRSAVRLCDADHSSLFQFDGKLITRAASFNMTADEFDVTRRLFPRPPARDSATGRAILERAVVHIPDIRSDPEFGIRPVQEALGFRATLAVPLLREGNPIGGISLWRREARPYSDRQIALVRTFADQAVIAIENVRLFEELQARNRDLTEALEQQTATAEILRVISGSPTDVQPVFDIIGERAEKLCDAEVSAVSRFDGELIHLVALHGMAPEGVEAARRVFPHPAGRRDGDGAGGSGLCCRSYPGRTRRSTL